jgi:phospholipid/cholesterol/gamma-HCH transport system substrate-binding protein
VVVAVAVVFFVFAYQTAGVGTGSGGYLLKARFSQVGGLVVGGDVRLSGIKVGTIIDEELDTKQFDAIVTMSIRPDIQLPVDSEAQIASEGLLGGQHIALKPGIAEEKFAAGDIIEYTSGSIDLMQLIGKAVFGGGEGK